MLALRRGGIEVPHDAILVSTEVNVGLGQRHHLPLVDHVTHDSDKLGDALRHPVLLSHFHPTSSGPRDATVGRGQAIEPDGLCQRFP